MATSSEADDFGYVVSPGNQRWDEVTRTWVERLASLARSRETVPRLLGGSSLSGLVRASRHRSEELGPGKWRLSCSATVFVFGKLERRG